MYPCLHDGETLIFLSTGKLDVELKKYKDQMAKMRDGPQKNMVKQRALQVLKQKKQYESQHMGLQSQSFNMGQISYATQSLKDTQMQVSAMKSGVKAMKQEFKSINLNEVEDLQDDMSDMLEQSDEIQEILSRNYSCQEVDDADLEAEFDGLGDYATDGTSHLSFFTARSACSPRRHRNRHSR